jgi:hypothetical protein
VSGQLIASLTKGAIPVSAAGGWVYWDHGRVGQPDVHPRRKAGAVTNEPVPLPA